MNSNPYTPVSNSQLEMIIGIGEAAIDEHGQILGQYLDQVFDYVPYGGSNGIQACGAFRSDCERGSLVFSYALRNYLIVELILLSVERKIEEFEKCVDDTSIQLKKFGDNPSGLLGLCEGGKFIYFMYAYNLIVLTSLPSYQLTDCDAEKNQCAGDLVCFERDNDDPLPPGCGGSAEGEADYCYDPFCENELKRLPPIRNSLKKRLSGFKRLPNFSETTLDDSIALLFGNKTTIGQVCAYSRGLELKTVVNTTGFCCLDAPYEAQDWGETVSDTECQSLP